MNLKSCVFCIDTTVDWPYSPNQKEALGSPSLNSSLRPSESQ
jgi:hypothetical protein